MNDQQRPAIADGLDEQARAGLELDGAGVGRRGRGQCEGEQAAQQ
jgi:hypothetical protein